MKIPRSLNLRLSYRRDPFAWNIFLVSIFLVPIYVLFWGIVTSGQTHQVNTQNLRPSLGESALGILLFLSLPLSFLGCFFSPLFSSRSLDRKVALSIWAIMAWLGVLFVSFLIVSLTFDLPD